MPELPSGTITFLFTDIEGSTRLWEQDPDGMKSSLDLHRRVISEAVERAGGVVFKDSGDGLYSAFSSPAAAVSAASAAQTRLGATSWDDGPELRVRMGIHTGEATPTNGDYHGPPLNQCARLVDAGHGGQILASGVAVDLARSSLEGVDLLDLGEHRLRDLSDASRIFQVGEGDFAHLRTLDASPNNLPAQLSSFVGRERELGVVQGLLGDHRLVTLTGVGGTGKTRLALQVAADMVPEYPDGVFVVELASLSDPALIEERIGACIQVPSVAGELGAERDDSARLLSALRERSLLLVLDNCEHVIDATALIVDRILTECPDVSVLATSREALGIVGEQAWRVPSLKLPAGVSVGEFKASEGGRLLLDRVTLQEPEFTVTDDNVATLVEVCRRLDGIPLALELVAARLATMTPEDVLANLDNQFRLLTGGSRTALERHQTLRAAIDWSFELLSPEAQALLPMLSVFRGGWTLDGATEVCTSESLGALDVVDGLSELVAKSLVSRGQGDRARYSMVEPIRQYAAEHLESTRAAQVRDRHADWIASGVAIETHLDPGDPESSFVRAVFALDEYENFVEAVRWVTDNDRPDSALRLLGGGMFAILAGGQYREGLSLIDRALEREGGPCSLRYLNQHFAAYLSLWLDDPDGARDRLVSARAMGEQCPDVDSLFWVDLAQATIALTNGDAEEFAEYHDSLVAAREAARREGVDYPRNFATYLLGVGALYAGDPETALRLLQEAYEPMRDYPIAWVPYAPPSIAQAKLLLGHDDAGEALAEAEAVARFSGDPAAVAMVLHTKAMAGQLEDARDAVRETLDLERTIGLRTVYSMPPAVEYAHRVGAERLALRAYGALISRGTGPSRVFYDETAAELRERLGEEAYEAEIRRGAESKPIALLAEIAALEPRISEGG